MDRVSHALVKVVLKLIQKTLVSLYVLEVCPYCFEGNFQIAPEKQGVFCDKEVTAFFAKSRNVDAPSAYRNLAVFDDQTLVTWGGEAVVDEVRE
jgi:hypothetical protein